MKLLRLTWREVTRQPGNAANPETCRYLDAEVAIAEDMGHIQNVGYIQQLLPDGHYGAYSACDMSGAKWEWRKFDDLREAKMWLEVCARMLYAS